MKMSETVESTAPAQEPPMGTAQRLVGVFVEPGRTFESINWKPAFLLALVVAVLAGVGTTMVMHSKVDMAQAMETAIRNSSAGARMSSDEIRQQVEMVANNPFYKVMMWAGPILATPIMIFALSGILLLMVFVGSSETSYLKMLGVTSHAMLFYSVVGGVLLTIVLVLSPDPQAIDLQNPVYTNPGALVDAKEYPVLNRLASALDLVTLYTIYLLGLGLSKVAARMSVGKGVLLAGIPWLLYVGIGVLWRALFG
jgi:hypothetical protein